jgi:hypothetical protein
MNVMKAVCTAMVAVCVGATTLTPVSAAPMPAVRSVAGQNADVVQVRDDHRRPNYYDGRGDRNDRYSYRGRDHDRYSYREHDRDRRGYYRGYRGYHDRRPGYRRYNDGLWYPAAAFALGAIIGGSINR